MSMCRIVAATSRDQKESSDPAILIPKMQISVTSPPSPAASPTTAASSTGTRKTTGIAIPSTSGSSRETNAIDAKWQVAYGFWDDLDVLYNEPSFLPPTKPRVPSQQLDDAQEWAKRMVPTSSEAFIGNPTALQCLHSLQTGDANPLTNFIISGAECTGKLSLIGLLKRTLLASGFDPPCSFGSVNAKHFGEKDLLLKIEDFVRRVDPNRVKVAFLVVERFESVTPSTQQHYLLPILQDANAKSVFFIFHVRPDASKVAEQIKQKSMKVHLHQLKPVQVRAKLLHICKQERVSSASIALCRTINVVINTFFVWLVVQIGYTRDGLEELLRHCEFNLLHCMERLRLVFLAHFFISPPNVLKKVKTITENDNNNDSSPTKPVESKRSAKTNKKPEPPPFPLSILEMSEPLRRCKKCTLVPPCSHITMETLSDKIQRIRNLYPHQDDDDDDNDGENEPAPSICPSFLNTGVCTSIQSLGRCRYAHPLTLHQIDTSQLVKRCRVHTLPMPCTHCANIGALKDQLRTEIKVCMQLEAQLRTRRKQLSDVEMDKFLLMRDRNKSVKWGTAKRELEDKLAHLDATLKGLHAEIEAMAAEQTTRQARRDQLVRDNERGTSHGTLSTRLAQQRA